MKMYALIACCLLYAMSPILLSPNNINTIAGCIFYVCTVITFYMLCISGDNININIGANIANVTDIATSANEICVTGYKIGVAGCNIAVAVEITWSLLGRIFAA